MDPLPMYCGSGVRETSLSEILLNGSSSALDSIFAAVSAPEEERRRHAMRTSSAVFHYQGEQLKRLAGQRCTGYAPAGVPKREKKNYRGVRQRRWGKWVAEIRLPQNRTRVWLGTYGSAEAAAHAYDRATYKLRGEYARLNFPDLRNSGTGPVEPRLGALRSSVDAKIQAIYKRMNQKTKKNKMMNRGSSRCSAEELKRKVGVEEDWEMTVMAVAMAGTNSFSSSVESSPSISEDSAMNRDYQMDKAQAECSFFQMPSFDPDVIWQILAN